MVYSQQKLFCNKLKLIKSVLEDLLWVTGINCGAVYILSEVSWFKKKKRQWSPGALIFTWSSQEPFLLAACSVFSLPSISHSQHVFLLLASHVQIRVWRPRSPYLCNTTIWLQGEFQCSGTPARFWEPRKDSQLTGCLVLCKSQMPLKSSIKSWLTCCPCWEETSFPVNSHYC